LGLEQRPDPSLLLEQFREPYVKYSCACVTASVPEPGVAALRRTGDVAYGLGIVLFQGGGVFHLVTSPSGYL
jgi:hypothetical protein